MALDRVPAARRPLCFAAQRGGQNITAQELFFVELEKEVKRIDEFVVVSSSA